MEQLAVVVGTGSYRAQDDRTVQFPRRWTPQGVTVQADFTGAHLLHLAAAGCILEAAGTFDTDSRTGRPCRPTATSANLDGDAEEAKSSLVVALICQPAADHADSPEQVKTLLAPTAPC